VALTLVLTLAGYVVAAGLYLTALSRGGDRLARWAWVALAGAFLLHAVDIGVRCVAGIHPVATPQEAVSFATFVTVGAYLVLSRRGRLQVAGSFVTPVAIILLLVARATPAGDRGAPAPALGVIGRVHVSLAAVGVALFALAAALSLLYLLEETQLRHKRFGVLFHHGPPLARLDYYGHLCVTLGFPIFTAALVTGAMWVTRLPVRPPGVLRPEYVLALVTWLSFAALLIARLTAGWRGRRAAVLTLVGFGAALMVLGIYVTRSALGGA
jgi:ABC-type uncharacterized transport system permease subunit